MAAQTNHTQKKRVMGVLEGKTDALLSVRGTVCSEK
jgi:hypothetical protein